MSLNIPLKILLSARDPGAIGHINVLLDYYQGDSEVEFILSAAEPAYSILCKQGLEVIHFALPPATDYTPSTVNALVTNAGRIIKQVEPDVILAGTSNIHEASIDEALVVAAKHLRVPTFVMQDYWGVVNSFLHSYADAYFVIDSFAAYVTNIHHQVKTKIVGSVKHYSYCKLNPATIRYNARQLYNLLQNELVIGFFGQPLTSIAGYIDTIEYFSKMLYAFNPKVKLLYRPHPRESLQSKEVTVTVLNKYVSNVIISQVAEVYTDLATVDSVYSIFSTCCFDMLYLNRYSDIPLGTANYLLFDEELRWHAELVNDFKSLPVVSSELANVVKQRQDLPHNFDIACDPAEKARVWQESKIKLADVRCAPQKIIEFITRYISGYVEQAR